jgi:hypothetical protein
MPEVLDDVALGSYWAPTKSFLNEMTLACSRIQGSRKETSLINILRHKVHVPVVTYGDIEILDTRRDS